MQDITPEYKNIEGSHEQRLAVFNAVRGVTRAQQYYDFPDNIIEDVFFDLVDIEYIPFGQSFDVIVNIHVSSKRQPHLPVLTLTQKIKRYPKLGVPNSSLGDIIIYRVV